MVCVIFIMTFHGQVDTVVLKNLIMGVYYLSLICGTAVCISSTPALIHIQENRDLYF
jgi:hypothetical protein